MLCDSTSSRLAWLGVTPSLEAVLVCFKASFSRWRDSISSIILLSFSSISPSLPSMLVNVASWSRVSCKRVVAGMRKTHWVFLKEEIHTITQMAQNVMDVFQTPMNSCREPTPEEPKKARRV